MGESDMAEPGAPATQPRTPEHESQLARSSPEKWNLGALESGPDGEGEKANHSPAFSLKSATPEKSETVTYPEGGVRAWLVVFGSWCAVLVSLGIPSSFGAIQLYLVMHQLSTYNPSASGWVFSVYVFFAFAGSILVGPIFDKYGPMWLVLAGSIGACLSMFLLGICQQLWEFLIVFGFLGGLSACLLVNPAIAVIGHYFSKKRGNASGIVILSSATGAFLFPMMLKYLIPKVGFAWTTRLIGFVYVCACVPACTLIRSRLPPAKDASAKPACRVFKDSAFIVTMLSFYLLQWVFYVPVAYLFSYAMYHGVFFSAFSFPVLVAMNVAFTLGFWLPGLTSDKIGRFNSLIVMILLAAVLVLGVWLPVGHTKAGIIVFAIGYSFTSASTLTLGVVCIGQLCKTENYGRYLGTAFTLASIGFLTMILIGGKLIIRDGGDYQYMIIWVGLCLAGALAACVAARIMRTGWKLRVIF